MDEMLLTCAIVGVVVSAIPLLVVICPSIAHLLVMRRKREEAKHLYIKVK